MPNYTEAIREAFAYTPANQVILEAFEIRNTDLVDTNGNQTAIRIINQNENFNLTLEADAPLNAGESVLFMGYAVSTKLPVISDNAVPEMDFTIDGVSRTIITALIPVVRSNNIIYITYRLYLSTDLTTQVLEPPLTLQISSLSANQYTVQARARFGNLTNKAFPKALYTATNFPGLVR